jgi:antitoxin VapB
MPINIEDPEVEQLARELANETRESITEAVRKALEERLMRIRAKHRLRGPLENVDDILRRMDALPKINQLSERDILGYGDDGLPHRGR